MWFKDNKEKKEKNIAIGSTTIQQSTSSFSSEIQTVSVRRTEHRALHYQESSSNNNFSNITPTRQLTNTVSTRFSHPQVGTDAKPINLNYQSSFPRKSTVYRSIPSSTSYRSPVGTTGISPRPPLQVIVQPTTSVPAEPNKKIIVKKTKKFYDNDPLNKIPTYSTHSKHRGEVLIINNIMFANKGYRHGAKKDHEKLKSLFGQMSFNVKVEQDLKVERMVAVMKNFSRKSSLKGADIMIVVVMSHGTKNETLGGTEVFGLDERGILVDELIDCFNEKDCKAMKDKPKIFIFQCCRGDNEHFIQNDAKRIDVPPLNDALIAYSSLPGFSSHRDPEHGTWYISSICDVFSEHAHEHHVEDLLKIVDRKLSDYAKNVKQTTHYENRGFKRCYLHPL